MAGIANLKIQRWGNSLAVRIPSSIARSVHFTIGQPVEVIVQDSNIVVKPVGIPKLTLTQKLALFDLAKHGGETMASSLAGVELL